jgi:pimeloyl-ACP methyl ester carboxylesterase
LLLHGWGSNAHTFDELAPRLTDRFRVIALTQRGFGASGRPPTGYTLQRYADDAIALLDHLQVERAALVGHSFGGWVLTRIATTKPTRVSRLGYLDATFDMRRSDSIITLRPFQRPSTEGIKTETEYFAWLQRNFYGMWSPALEAEARTNVKYRATRAVQPALDDARTAPESWDRIGVPALAICALADVKSEFPWIAVGSPEYPRAREYVDTVRRPFQFAECRRFGQAVRASSTLELDGGHFIHVARLDDVVRALRGFLRDE